MYQCKDFTLTALKEIYALPCMVAPLFSVSFRASSQTQWDTELLPRKQSNYMLKSKMIYVYAKFWMYSKFILDLNDINTWQDAARHCIRDGKSKFDLFLRFFCLFLHFYPKCINQIDSYPLILLGKCSFYSILNCSGNFCHVPESFNTKQIENSWWCSSSFPSHVWELSELVIGSRELCIVASHNMEKLYKDKPKCFRCQWAQCKASLKSTRSSLWLWKKTENVW